MNIPEFTAQSSLYRTNNLYHHSAGSAYGDLRSGESIVPAYYPGTETQKSCNRCNEIALRNYGGCLAIGATACGLGCIASGPFYAACFAGCMGGVLAGCDLNLLREAGTCSLDDCCPKVCGVLNPLEPGVGCCDENESCVDRYDPNSRQGCCPSDQSVCGGKCCPKGHTCCGDTCCPPNHFCRDGFCSEFPGPSLWPDDWKPPKPPKRPINYCRIGYEPCGGTCCPPGLECCSVGGGRVACMTNCLH